MEENNGFDPSPNQTIPIDPTWILCLSYPVAGREHAVWREKQMLMNLWFKTRWLSPVLFIKNQNRGNFCEWRPTWYKKKVGFGSQITRWIYRVIQLRWMAIQPWCHYFHVHGVSNLPARKLHLSVLLYVLSVYVILYVFMWKHMKTCKIYIYTCVLFVV